jgi:hypothetical protein
MTIGSTPAKAEKMWGAAGLNNSNHFASGSHIKTLGFRIIDDTHQFAQLTDNESEAIELGSVEENGNDAGDTDSQGIIVAKKHEVQHHSIAKSIICSTREPIL